MDKPAGMNGVVRETAYHANGHARGAASQGVCREPPLRLRGLVMDKRKGAGADEER